MSETAPPSLPAGPVIPWDATDPWASLFVHIKSWVRTELELAGQGIVRADREHLNP